MSTISTIDNFTSENIRILSIDFETRQIMDGNSTRNQIFAVGFYSNAGIKEAIHLEDERFNSDEVKFIRYIIYKIQSFQGIITGWYLANSDLVILDEVCKSIGVSSPVEFYDVLLEDKDSIENEDDMEDQYKDLPVKSYPYLKDKKIIDMYKVFHHNFVKNSIYPFMYRDLQLDTVATGMLEGYGKYISESADIKITGENVLQFPIEEQKKYVLRDAELVIRLIERNNYEILNILRCIADIARLDFKQVCHAGVGKAWESIIYQAIRLGESERPSIVGLKKRKYSGALVLKPEPKSYTKPIEIFDVKGLYPTVMILHNLSFETVCCECCKDKPEAKVPQAIMYAINDGLKDKIKSAALFEAEKRKEAYWICVKNKGVIPNTLLKFKKQREYYRNKGDEPMSQALKVMMNSIYGLFGSEGIFEFQDYRVAELVTAFAREKLLEMKDLANNFGMNIIYGDTDSIFVSGVNRERSSVDAFIASCKQKLKVDVDHQNTFVKSILTGKKHYIGIQPDGKVIVKGMEGKKRDRPDFFRQVFGQLIDDYKNNIEDVSVNVLKAFRQLEAAEVDPSLLAYSIILSKDPNDYRSYTPQHKIGISLKKEAGEIIKYYKTGQRDDGYKDYSSNYQDLNIDVYKLELWNVVKEILRLLDYDIQSIEKQIFPDDEELEDDYVVPRNDQTVIRRKDSKNVRSSQNQPANESLSRYQISVPIISVG